MREKYMKKTLRSLWKRLESNTSLSNFEKKIFRMFPLLREGRDFNVIRHEIDVDRSLGSNQHSFKRIIKEIQFKEEVYYKILNDKRMSKVVRREETSERIKKIDYPSLEEILYEIDPQSDERAEKWKFLKDEKYKYLDQL